MALDLKLHSRIGIKLMLKSRIVGGIPTDPELIAGRAAPNGSVRS